MIWLLSIFGVGKRVIGVMLSKPVYIAVAVAAIFAILWQFADARADKWHKRHDDVAAARKFDRETYHTAQQQAATAQAQYNTDLAAKYAKQKKEAEYEYKTSLAANTANFNEWMQRQAANRIARRANPRTASSVPGAAVRTSAETIVYAARDGFITIPIHDAELTVEAFTRLDALQAWAKGLEAPTRDR
jgi:hypothetical protein